MAVLAVTQTAAAQRSAPADLAHAGVAAGALTRPQGFGVNVPDEIFPDPDGALGNAHMAELRQEVERAGAAWLRTDVTADLYKALVGTAEGCSGEPCASNGLSGLNVLGVIDHVTLRGAAELPCGFAPGAISETRFTLEQWSTLVACVATLFKGRVRAYEIWNEPTVCASERLCFKGGFQDGSAEHYARMLTAAARAIRAVDPQALVIALGGVAANVGGANGRTALEDDFRFSARVAKLAGPTVADAISVHAYSWDRCDRRTWRSYRSAIARYREVWELPVWVTETGQRAGRPCSQTRYLKGARDAFAKAAVDRVFWFSLRDTPDGRFGIAGRTPVNFLLGGLAASPAGETVVAGPVSAPEWPTDFGPQVSPLLVSTTWSVDWVPLDAGGYIAEFADPFATAGVTGLALPPPARVEIRSGMTTAVTVDVVSGQVRAEYAPSPPVASGKGLLRVETVPPSAVAIRIVHE